jgi:hypothetical protein
MEEDAAMGSRDRPRKEPKRKPKEKAPKLAPQAPAYQPPQSVEVIKRKRKPRSEPGSDEA